jgi:tRNA(Ile)-lysidine synthase
VEPLEAKVADFIGANGLFAEARAVLLAVSGGADSIALLHVMKALVAEGALATELACVHVNHQLRGDESAGDETFVLQLASKLGLPIVSRTVDVKRRAEADRLSVETAGRRVRLACFAETARAQGCTWVATGHQRDDNAETVLQRLRRGTGFRGLAAIRPARRLEEGLWLARPLLDCTRAEIIAYLRNRDLTWREDRTNTDCRYTRNYVRHCLLPTLQNQSAVTLVDGLSDLAASARRLHERVSTQAKQAARSVITTEGRVSIDAMTLTALPGIVAAELIRLQLPKLGCGERDLTRHHYESILQLALHPAGKRTLTLPSGLSVRSEYGSLILQRRQPADRKTTNSQDVILDIPGTAALAGRRIEARVLDPSESTALEITGDKGPFLEYLDLDRVGRSLVVRRRRPGDRFRPLGMPREKKLGKFLTAARVPETVREAVLVFDDGQRIVWVCPLRISEHAKVTRATRHVLMLAVSDANRRL